MSDVSKTKRARYLPLNVKTWKEGLLESSPIPLVGLFAFVTAGLLVIYELVFHYTFQDADFRDILFDQRITNGPRNFYHQNFMKATFCCHVDFSTQPETGVLSSACNDNAMSSRGYTYGSEYIPYACPPMVVAFCNFLLYPKQCLKAKTALFSIAGVDPNGGGYVDCTRAGRVRVGYMPQFGYTSITNSSMSNTTNTSEVIGRLQSLAAAIANAGAFGEMYNESLPYHSDFGAAYASLLAGDVDGLADSSLAADEVEVPVTFVAFYNQGNVGPHYITDANSINMTKLAELVDTVAATQVDPTGLYVQPSKPLGASFVLNGSALPLTPKARVTQKGIKGVQPWPSGIWAFPGMNKRCPDTELAQAYYLDASTSMSFPNFSYAALPALRVRVQAGDDGPGTWAPLYKIEVVEPEEEDGLSPDASGVLTFRIGRLKQIDLTIGLAPMYGACGAWRLVPVGGAPLRQGARSRDGEQYELSQQFQYDWIQTYTGVLADVPNITGSTEAPLLLPVYVRLLDVSMPAPIELPSYSGLLYVFAALPLAFTWLVCTALTILFIPLLIWWNVQATRGLPFVWYRWTRRHRGW